MSFHVSDLADYANLLLTVLQKVTDLVNLSTAIILFFITPIGSKHNNDAIRIDAQLILWLSR